MIDQAIRNALLEKTIRQDWDKAAQIYKKNNNRFIYPRYLERFLRGYSNPTGRFAGSHQPLRMFEAIAQAVAERQQAERDQTAKALQILQTKIRIDKPQPIPA